MHPPDLLRAAYDLVAANKGKPRQVHLRRATSTTYYAVFHALARCCADLLIGGPNSAKSKEAWNQTYRALQHGFAKDACLNKKVIALFPQEIQDFADLFVTMQKKRHEADYDPHAKFFKSAVLFDIALADVIISVFKTASAKDRRAFAAFVLFKPRA